jgi:hypothetical protein
LAKSEGVTSPGSAPCRPRQIFVAQQRVDIALAQLTPMTQDDPRLGAAIEEFENALEARLDAEHAGGR